MYKSWSILWFCLGLVEQILVNTLEMNTMLLKKGICGCTPLGHKEIRAAINEGEFESVYDVFSKLDWKTADGCSKCRPAVNFFTCKI